MEIALYNDNNMDFVMVDIISYQIGNLKGGDCMKQIHPLAFLVLANLI